MDRLTALSSALGVDEGQVARIARLEGRLLLLPPDELAVKVQLLRQLLGGLPLQDVITMLESAPGLLMR